MHWCLLLCDIYIVANGMATKKRARKDEDRIGNVVAHHVFFSLLVMGMQAWSKNGITLWMLSMGLTLSKRKVLQIAKSIGLA